LAFGTCYAVKSGKAWKKRGKAMSLLDKDVVLTTQEAIQYLKISKPTYLKYIRLGRIKAIKAGSGWRVHQSELFRFLKVGESK
jgi:excisionase family DNA binding protein